MKKLYTFDPITGKYIGEVEAELDAWQSEVAGYECYKPIANAVWTKPEEKEGYTPYMYNGEWVLVKNPTLDELKTEKLKEIDTWTSNKIVGGFVSDASGASVRYDSDKDTQLTMQGIALNVNTSLFEQEYPQGCPVRGYAEGAEVKSVFWLNPEQVLKWQADLSMHIGTCKQEGWAKQAEVNKAKTVDELEAIVLE